jgi:hypothetical protein
MAMRDLPLLKKRLPEVLAKDVDHTLYYYFPRNLEDPEKIMRVIASNLRQSYS